MVYVTAVHLIGTEDHEHIGSVRWRNPADGKTGESTRADMVTWIRDKNGDARVQATPADVKIGVVEASPPYIRTYADGKWTNNLLSLPRY